MYFCFMLSNISKYAISALSLIAKNSTKEEKTKVGEIAERYNIPQAFLSKILQKLTKTGYLSSMKGPNGGFFLNDVQMNHSVLDIIIELEGEDIFAKCILRFEACDSDNPCPIHFLINKEKSQINLRLKKIKIKDLIQEKSFERISSEEL